MMRRFMMFRAVAVLLLTLGLAGPSWAQTDVSAADRAAIRDVITRQIEAFQHDDGDAAFAFASRGIQDQFGNPDRFLAMVRRAYPAVHRPRSVDFSELLLGDGVIVQQVELAGPNGEAELALYSMERDAAGMWRISGCTLVPSARIGT